MSATTPQAISDATGTDESAVAQAASIKSVYVYQAPVRVWHWVNALSLVVLCLTGYFIGSPLPTQPGEASANYLMGYIRFAHFSAGYVFAVGLLGRENGFFGNAARDLSPFGETVCAAVFQFARQPSETAAVQFQRSSRRGVSIFALHDQSAAQGIQSKQRIGTWQQSDFGHGNARNQIPTDHIAKRLIQSDAIQIDGQALRRSQQRRRGVAAIIQIRLIRIALNFVEMNGSEPTVQQIRDVLRVAGLDVL